MLFEMFVKLGSTWLWRGLPLSADRRQSTRSDLFVGRRHAYEIAIIIRETLAKLGATARPGSPQDFASFMAAESKKWSETINAANIKAD